MLHCHLYIELNRVPARMTDDPAAYPWSSCTSHCGLRHQIILSSHPQYTALGRASQAHAEASDHLLRETLSDDDIPVIRTYLLQQGALRWDHFRVIVEAETQRFADVRPAHQPPQAEQAPNK